MSNRYRFVYVHVQSNEYINHSSLPAPRKEFIFWIQRGGKQVNEYASSMGFISFLSPRVHPHKQSENRLDAMIFTQRMYAYVVIVGFEKTTPNRLVRIPPPKKKQMQ